MTFTISSLLNDPMVSDFISTISQVKRDRKKNRFRITKLENRYEGSNPVAKVVQRPAVGNENFDFHDV